MDPQPEAGALVHGAFTELDQGNRLHRAVIGFGAGEARMDSYVTMNDPARPDKPLYKDFESGTSGKNGPNNYHEPLCGCVQVRNEKDATEKTIKKTASEFSKDIIMH